MNVVYQSLVVFICFLCYSMPVAGQVESNSSVTVNAQLGKLKSASPDSYDSNIESITKENDDIKFLLTNMQRGVEPQPSSDRKEKLKQGWSAWEATDENNITRPYQVYCPQSIADGAKPKAVVVHIHGAVARADFGTGLGSAQAVGYAGFLWPKVAEANDLLIVCPLGRTECAWWTDNGVSHIRAVIRDARRTIAFSDRKIFGAGFSDGASGCYYLAMAAHDPFAGFIAMNGHMAVASSASGKQLYLRNMRNTPLVSAMTQEDSLYPSKTVLPHVTLAITAGAPITVVSYPNVRHQPSYFEDQTQAFLTFMKANKRDDDRKNVSWITSDASIGNSGWLEMLELGETKTQGPVLGDLNLMTEPTGKVSLGVELESFTEAKIKRVVENSAAATAGLQAGDTVVQLGDTNVVGTRELRTALSKFTYEDKFTCIVTRGALEVSLEGQFPKFESEPYYLRKKPTSYANCRISTDGKPQVVLVSRNVRKARVWLPIDFVEGDEVEVVCGFKDDTVTKTLPIVRLSAKELLKRYAENPDGAIRACYVDIEVE